jgi:Family of unknown function (DUF6161)
MDKQSTEAPSAAPNPPLFTLDLGANGGVFAPTMIEEMQLWVNEELSFWSWTQQINVGQHQAVITQAWHFLNTASSAAREAVQHVLSGQESVWRDRANQVQSNVRAAFIDCRLPHSSTPLAQRVVALKAEPQCAIAYLFAFISSAPSNNQFDARDPQSWRGFINGLIDRYCIVTDVEPKIAAEREALERLRVSADKLLANKTEEVNQIHRDISQVASDIAVTKKGQVDEFATLVIDSKKEHGDALTKHAGEMETLRKTFREAMALRAPVEYWQGKAASHNAKTALWMGRTFTSMAALAAGLGLGALWVFKTLTDGKPDAWKLAVLSLVGVLGVWAVRLVVRLYLSHAHLATDAEERVTMVQTYLALLEGEKMLSDEDRKLILTPLFRPAADGLVKDEGLPHPLLEWFTRGGQK